MRIAWVSYGFGEYCARQVAALAEGHDVLLAMPEDEVAPHRGLLPSSVELFPFRPGRLRQPLRQWSAARAVVRRVRAFAPDVVHYQHGHLWFNLLGLPALRRWPLVVTIHDPRRHTGDRVSRKTPQWVMDLGFRSADRAIVHGESLRDVVEHELGIDRGRIDVAPHVAMGLPDRIDPAAEEPATVLFFGRIYAYKGLEYLLRAAPLVAERVPAARFVIAGDGDDFAALRPLITEPWRFDLRLGWATEAERAALFARAAVVVLPYTEATQSGVTPVAYANAKPVVASDVGALGECVRHGETGLLVPPRDVAALADAIATLLENPAERRRMGANGRALLDAEWSPGVVAQKTLRVYDRAVAGRRGAPLPAPRRVAADLSTHPS